MTPDFPLDHSAKALLKTLRTVTLLPPSSAWPRLFADANDMDAIRERTRMIDDLGDQLVARAENVIQDADVFASEPAWNFRHQSAVLTLATAAWFTGEERLVSLTTRVMDRAASAEDWVAEENKPMACDHVAANVGAMFAQCMDLLAGRLTNDHIARYREAVREKCLNPFLDACRTRDPSWSKRDCPSNWRIMTCGDAGLAALGMVDNDADIAEILAYSVEGVVDILNQIPENGDFAEGPGHFVSALWMGLRFLSALSRRWPQASGWVNHSRLDATCDYLQHVTMPDGSVFNYFDNSDRWDAEQRACMLLMAHMCGRNDIAVLARGGDIESVNQFIFDSPDRT
jgi:hypothetical protein